MSDLKILHYEHHDKWLIGLLVECKETLWYLYFIVLIFAAEALPLITSSFATILFVWVYFSMTLCWTMPLFWFQKGKKHDADDFISDGSSDERPRKKRRGSDAENEDGEGRKKKKRRFVFPVHHKILVQTTM